MNEDKTCHQRRSLAIIPFLAMLLVALLATTVQAAGDPTVGKALFTGKQAMEKGGPACISCHSVRGMTGGTLKDLTGTYSRLGEAGVVKIIKDPPPLMKGVFANNPMTEAEIGHLTAFLAEVSAGAASNGASQGNQGGTFDPVFPMIGLGGALLMIVVSQLLWRNRFRGVRKQLVGGSKG